MSLALSVRGLSKSYKIGSQQEQHSTLTESILHKIKNPRSILGSRKETFHALKDISFDIQQGDVVGIIGRNGAGKSTLLKILSRITEPTSGEIDLYGRVGSLLEVGTGFHPELTGRENIFLNGAILGMAKDEIKKQFDAIVDFSGVEKFIDTPVKRYSSGMYVRLAFAVAAHLRSDIIIVDEVLAVGDAQFQQKCLGKMSDVASAGRTVIFVSHNMSAVADLCKKAILLKKGTISQIGKADQVVDSYLADDRLNTNSYLRLASENDRSGTGLVRLRSVTITNLLNAKLVTVPTGGGAKIVFECENLTGDFIKNLSVGYSFHTKKDETILIRYSHYDKEELIAPPGKFIVTSAIEEIPLKNGIYNIGVRILINQTESDWPKYPIEKLIVQGNLNTNEIVHKDAGEALLVLKTAWAQ